MLRNTPGMATRSRSPETGLGTPTDSIAPTWGEEGSRGVAAAVVIVVVFVVGAVVIPVIVIAVFVFFVIVVTVVIVVFIVIVVVLVLIVHIIIIVAVANVVDITVTDFVVCACACACTHNQTDKQFHSGKFPPQRCAKHLRTSTSPITLHATRRTSAVPAAHSWPDRCNSHAIAL